MLSSLIIVFSESTDERERERENHQVKLYDENGLEKREEKKKKDERTFQYFGKRLEKRI